MSKLKIPEALLDGALPDNAVYELETHMAYVIEKYGLKKGRKQSITTCFYSSCLLYLLMDISIRRVPIAQMK